MIRPVGARSVATGGVHEPNHDLDADGLDEV
jgi:hypothetical protein